MRIANSLLVGAILTAITSNAIAATITQGDVTSSLEGMFFFDDARTGGGDATANEPNSITVQRFFDFDGDGAIAAPGVPGTLTIQGFGFATSGATAANDATQVDLSFIYLGNDEVFGGGDDVEIGTERVGYTHVGAGEYFVNFDTDPSAMIDGLGSRFRVVATPVGLDDQLVESIRMKTRPGNEQSFGHNGATMSITGSFAAVPEPTAAVLASSLFAIGLGIKRQR